MIWDEAEELQRLAEISDPNPTIRTAGLDPRATELANLLAERIDQLSTTSLESLILQLRSASSKDRRLGSTDLRDQT